MKKRLFPLLITLAALAVSGSAAFYSVFGLSKLFAGASTQVIIMAGSLEFAKLVVASLLYQYWGTINKVLKGYLMIACFVLMVITSGGIYGFLSGAYQTTATQSELLDKSLLILEQKQVRFEESKEDLTIEKTQINKSISDLRVSLSNPQQVSWFDKNSQTVITSTSSSARRALQSELKTTIADRDNINIKIEAVMDSINKTDIALLDKEVSNEAESELGPLKYLASTTGWPMDKVVNYFLLLIVFVFDPLAIALVVAANMAFAQIRKPEDDTVEDYFQARNKEIERVVMSVPEGMEFNTPYPMHTPSEPSESLKQRVKENQEKLKEKTEWDKWREVQKALNYPKITSTIPTHDPQTGEVNPYYKELTGKENPLDKEEFDDIPEEIKDKEDQLMLEEDERRMDIIGQNGNDGLHYEKEPIEDEEYFTDLEDYINFTKEEEGPEYLNYPKFVKQDYPVKDKSYKEEYTGEPERLTDTTQTLIVKKLDDNLEENIKDEKPNEKPTRVLRYTKDR